MSHSVRSRKHCPVGRYRRAVEPDSRALTQLGECKEGVPGNFWHNEMLQHIKALVNLT